jgi:hypothetical protein
VSERKVSNFPGELGKRSESWRYMLAFCLHAFHPLGGLLRPVEAGYERIRRMVFLGSMMKTLRMVKAIPFSSTLAERGEISVDFGVLLEETASQPRSLEALCYDKRIV